MIKEFFFFLYIFSSISWSNEIKWKIISQDHLNYFRLVNHYFVMYVKQSVHVSRCNRTLDTILVAFQRLKFFSFSSFFYLLIYFFCSFFFFFFSFNCFKCHWTRKFVHHRTRSSILKLNIANHLRKYNDRHVSL